MKKQLREQIPVAIFIAMFFCGLTLLSWCVFLEEKARQGSELVATLTPLIGEHLASAVIVASLMGLTYEWFVHARVTTEIARAIKNQGEDFERVVESLRTTNAQEVFALIHNIAERQKGLPTLYHPAREEADELVFSTHFPFFQRLLATPSGREQVVEALRRWIDPKSSTNVRFLGSDFIGLFELHELAPALREVVAEGRQGWTTLPLQEKSCLLNYIWASSLFQEPKYKDLRDALLSTKDSFVQHWILFVPLQMPSRELADLVDGFLKKHGGDVSCEVLKSAIMAIGALHRYGIDMSEMVTRNRALIERCKLDDLATSEMVGPLPARRNRGLGERLRHWRRT